MNIFLGAGISLLVSGLCLAQEAAADPEHPRAIWNGVFARMEMRDSDRQANAFMREVCADLKPGRALDAGIGEGRNSLWLAEHGWNVTGVDISDKGVSMAQAAAREKGVKINTVVANLHDYDYGDEQWDLVVSTYMHGILARNAEKVVASLKPGGLLLVEGLHWDLNVESVQGGRFGFKTNELLRVFDSLRILYYQDLSADADWGRGRPGDKPIVRFLARKPGGQQ